MIRDHQTYYDGLHIHQPYYFPPSVSCVDLVTCHLPFQLFVKCNLERTIDPSAVTPMSSENGNVHKAVLHFSCLGIFDSTSQQTSFLAPETDFRGSVSGQSSQRNFFSPLPSPPQPTLNRNDVQRSKSCRVSLRRSPKQSQICYTPWDSQDLYPHSKRCYQTTPSAERTRGCGRGNCSLKYSQ